ncbi:hypothetical protein BABINDRAFT_10607, partial [Babjeviella inositovora NRRL Y-12698]
MKLSPIFLVPFLFQVATAVINVTSVTTSLTNPAPSNLCDSFVTSGGQGVHAWLATANFFAASTRDSGNMYDRLRHYEYVVQWFFTFDSQLDATGFDISTLTSAISLRTTVNVVVNPTQGSYILSYNDTVAHPLVSGEDRNKGLNSFNSLIGYTTIFTGGPNPTIVILGSSEFWTKPAHGLTCTINSVTPNCIALGYPVFSKCMTWCECTDSNPPSGGHHHHPGGHHPSAITATLTSTQSDGCLIVEEMVESAHTYSTTLLQTNTRTVTQTRERRSATATVFFRPRFTTFRSTFTTTQTQIDTQIALVTTVSTSLLNAVTLCPASSVAPSVVSSDAASSAAGSSAPASSAAGSSAPASSAAGSSAPASSASGSSAPASSATGSSAQASSAAGSSAQASSAAGSSAQASSAAGSSAPASSVAVSSVSLSSASNVITGTTTSTVFVTSTQFTATSF